jgi:hypothetical protein
MHLLPIQISNLLILPLHISSHFKTLLLTISLVTPLHVMNKLFLIYMNKDIKNLSKELGKEGKYKI